MPKKINVKGPIVNNDTAWLYEWLGWEYASPGSIAKELDGAGGEPVVLEINSPGGAVIAGYEMYSRIMEYEGEVTAHVISACSAATLPACAADRTLISDAGIFMIHNVQSMADGDYRDLQNGADALRQFNEGIINVYEKKTGMSRDEIQNLMDSDKYMSPQTAVKYRFVDGYLYGEPGAEGKAAEEDHVDFISSIAASGAQIISSAKAKELMTAIRSVKQQASGDGSGAGSRKDTEGERKMTLSEFLSENPDARSEITAIQENARAEGQKAEMERMKSLDAISGTVTKEALNDAKYGEKPIDGPTLAYQTALSDRKLASVYMEKALEDSTESGAGEVGIGNPDAGQEQTDNADEMASYINRMRGGKHA